MSETRVTAEQFEHLLRSGMRLAEVFDLRVESLAHGRARLRLLYDERHLRPGESIAGPVMFTLADTALLGMVLSVVGPEMAVVTSDMSIRFLRRPGPADLLAEARLLKGGRRLMVGEVTIWSEGQSDPVAHVTGTYALPARPQNIFESEASG